MAAIKFLASFIVLTVHFKIVHSANILFLFPLATKSHKNVFEPLIVALAERGHNLTVLTPLKLSNSHSNVREIVPVPFNEIGWGASSNDPFEDRKQGKINFFLNWNTTFIQVACNKIYQRQEVQELLKNERGTFDVIVVNALMNGCTVGMVHALQAPHIYLITMPAMNFLVKKAGLHYPPSFVPNSFAPFGDKMNFKERVLNYVADQFMNIMGKISWNTYYSKMYQDHLGADFPNINEIDKNLSLVLTNSHFSLSYPRPVQPDVVEVGGMHTRPPKPLPKEFEDFISGATDGFILFSLGSIVQAKMMPVDMRNRFINVFSRLKQRIVWKWEGDVPENLPNSVMMAPWVPQQDLLGHPKIKAFITHGGMLSTQEAVYHGTPMIGFPFFADQDLNMKQAEKAGYAIMLEINDFTEEKLERALNKILVGKEIPNRAAELSSIFRDQPHTPLENAVYWVEYVIKYKGARHMRSAGRDLNYFQYHSIDVVSFLMFFALVVVWLAYKKALTLIRVLLQSVRQKKVSRDYAKITKSKKFH